MTTRKKLIEVALPLEAVNRASAREIHPPRPSFHAAFMALAAGTLAGVY